ncbi:hypothetical protein CPC735_007950 [Coccidioides posadasii C735 delta SOWgp]|uniref:Cytochrome b561 domain-containing protein n=1 Tax=Coccidioides posadasii (strain C735) TaxID=222929 RepID=C5PA60_COCP7|nr:hypothetical protein CPC735_007950 [Coccidioides posadasii C735 delta SOWgp]EER26622.1 hypothetical protein CPC735_007950 [Coccidioides posadasii C735 delta SOWgp]|eukprot:XP_003068767.1 hypothetical protein CPC735_007950 [Coccidioides posadasii C735 delta SOWgp]
MASATGIPEARPASIHENGEEEPLLGRPGDVTQKENQSILINLVTVLLTTQAILLLQPTHTPSQKRQGTLTHFGVIVASNLTFVAAFTIIEINKASHPETRFTSVHAIMGLITYILIVLQAAVGAAQYFFPAQVFGSIDNGKRVYKWHRLFGYALLVMELATIAAATQTDYNKTVLHIRLWAVLLASVLVIAGIYARIKKQKMPLFKRQRPRERSD